MHQVFISYSTKDAQPALAICAALEHAGIRCWIAPRDIVSGTEWGAAIIAGIQASKAVLVVFSAHSNASPQVVRELEAAVSSRLPLIPVRIADELPTQSMQFFLGVSHWLDAYPPPLEPFLPRIVETARQVVQGHRFPLRLPRTRFGQLALGAAGVVTAALLAAWLARPSFNVADAARSPLAGRWEAELAGPAGRKQRCVLDVQPQGQFAFGDGCPFPTTGARGTINAQKGGVWAQQSFREGRDDGSYIILGSALHNVAGSYQRSSFGGGLTTHDPLLGDVAWSKSGGSDPLPAAGADVLPAKADWPVRNVASLAQKSIAYVRAHWHADAVLMDLEFERLETNNAALGNLPSAGGMLQASFHFYSPSKQERLQFMPRSPVGALFPQGTANVDPRYALPARFLDLPDAVVRARQAGMQAKEVTAAALRWSSGAACGSFREANALVPPCRGDRYTGWQWEIMPAFGDRIYVPAALAP